MLIKNYELKINNLTRINLFYRNSYQFLIALPFREKL